MPRKKIAPKKETTASIPKVKGSEKERETVIMFVDIMGASEVSNHKSPSDYARFVNTFQSLFKRICKRFIEGWYEEDDINNIQYSARGDEGLLMIYRPKDKSDVSGDIDIAVNIALELKREWMCLVDNSDRIIKSGLLPIDLAIGIHAGKTYLEGGTKTEENPGGWLPEGYAINLAKRVESYSRQGRFTHVFLSEAAQGYLNYLPDERTYLFDNPQVFSPKGITRDIRVYEIKHHFLPTDWKEESDISNRARTLLDPSCVKIDVLQQALTINPTNLWLVEEFIRSSMLNEYGNLTRAQREDDQYLRQAFEPALQQATRLIQSDQRDAGALFIQGLIEGECGDYVSERARYSDAIKYTDQLAEAYWYKGLSWSYQIWDSTGGDLDITRDDLSPELMKCADEAIESLKQATIRRSQAAWILYDYGCEIIRWAQADEEITKGIQQVELAVNRLNDVRYAISDQPYLTSVLDDPRILRLIPKQE